MAERKADRVGEQVGSYRLTRLLGVGGCGDVYAAEHQRLQYQRAIKLLSGEDARTPDLRARFLHEAQLLEQLQHPPYSARAGAGSGR
jgi:serine/threonine protein kinase